MHLIGKSQGREINWNKIWKIYLKIIFFYFKLLKSYLDKKKKPSIKSLCHLYIKKTFLILKENCCKIYPQIHQYSDLYIILLILQEFCILVTHFLYFNEILFSSVFTDRHSFCVRISRWKCTSSSLTTVSRTVSMNQREILDRQKLSKVYLNLCE